MLKNMTCMYSWMCKMYSDQQLLLLLLLHLWCLCRLLKKNGTARELQQWHNGWRTTHQEVSGRFRIQQPSWAVSGPMQVYFPRWTDRWCPLWVTRYHLVIEGPIWFMIDETHRESYQILNQQLVEWSQNACVTWCFKLLTQGERFKCVSLFSCRLCLLWPTSITLKTAINQINSLCLSLTLYNTLEVRWFTFLCRFINDSPESSEWKYDLNVNLQLLAMYGDHSNTAASPVTNPETCVNSQDLTCKAL